MSKQMNSLDTKNNALVVKDALTLQVLGLPSLEERPIVHENFALVIRTLLQNARQGTVGCKNRSQVSGSNKKPWKQKGTGRARAGAVTSPLWRGGGVIFGPQPRTRMLRVSKTVRQLASQDLVRRCISQDRLFVVDWHIAGDLPKTKLAHEMLKGLGVAGQMVNVFVSFEDKKTVASLVNIPWVRVVYFDSANAYVLADARYWVVLKKDVDAFKKMVAQWN